MNSKTRRNSGRYTPEYVEKLPFELREQLDILEERTLWDNWIDYRDGFRLGTFFNKDSLNKLTKIMKLTNNFKYKPIWRKIRELKENGSYY